MLVIPAIDLLDGQCVRLHQGDFGQKKVYSDNPSEMAKRFVDAGLPFLHVVDLNGAKIGSVASWKCIESIASVDGAAIEVGGGIRSSDDIRRLLDVGVFRVVIGSVAAKSPELVGYWIEQFGPDKIVIGMDVKEGSVAVSGWLEDSHRLPSDFVLDMISRNAKTFIATDISRDGTLEGPNIDFFASLKKAFPAIGLIASGGIGTAGDVLLLKQSGVAGAIVGKALYEGRVTLKELVSTIHG